jgi:hypothetical protein
VITAVDTNVLIDIFRGDPQFGEPSSNALRLCLQQGQVVVCDVVWAEIAAFFPSHAQFEATLHELPIGFVPMDRESAALAGRIWREYRAEGGGRSRVVADFLIAAHALHHCDRLLTRDQGFYRRYFQKLLVLDSTQLQEPKQT